MAMFLPEIQRPKAADHQVEVKQTIMVWGIAMSCQRDSVLPV